MAPRLPARVWFWCAVAVLLVPVLLASDGFTRTGLSADEIRSMAVAGAAHFGPLDYPGGIIARLTAESPDQAFGWPLVVRPWGELVGWSTVAMRALPWLCGLLTLAVVYRLGAEMFTPPVGIAAALLLTTSALYVAFTFKFRVYSLASLLSALVLWAYWRLWFCAGTADVLAAVGFVAAGAALCYTHYFALPFAVGLALHHLLTFENRRRWWSVVGLGALIVVLFVPQLLQLRAGVAFNTTRDLTETHDLFSHVGMLRAVGVYFGNGQPWLFVPLMLVVLVASVRGWREAPVRLLVTLMIGMLATFLVLRSVIDVFLVTRVRYFLILWVPLALWLGWGITQLGRVWRPLPLPLLAVWSVVGVVTIQNADFVYSIGEDERRRPVMWPALQIVRGQFTEGDTLLLAGNPLDRYNHLREGIAPADFLAFYLEPEAVAAKLPDAVDAHQRVWLLRRTSGDQRQYDREAQVYLYEQGYRLCDFPYTGPDFDLVLYGAGRALCPVDAEPPVRYGEVFRLVNWAVERESDAFTVSTLWATDTETAPFHSQGVYLLDADGVTVAQADAGMGSSADGLAPLRVTLALPDDLPPGDYDLALKLYNWETGDALPLAVPDAARAHPGDVLLLARVAIP